jgi:signal transduction histidine kinase
VLVSNAVAALEGASDRNIWLRAEVEGSDLVIRVEDSGPGVPAAIEPRLFEPFVSGRGRDSAHPGTGLGLAIARRAVARHGGSIWHERRAEGGARFVVRWPRETSHG